MAGNRARKTPTRGFNLRRGESACAPLSSIPASCSSCKSCQNSLFAISLGIFRLEFSFPPPLGDAAAARGEQEFCAGSILPLGSAYSCKDWNEILWDSSMFRGTGKPPTGAGWAVPVNVKTNQARADPIEGIAVAGSRSWDSTRHLMMALSTWVKGWSASSHPAPPSSATRSRILSFLSSSQ